MLNKNALVFALVLAASCGCGGKLAAKDFSASNFSSQFGLSAQGPMNAEGPQVPPPPPVPPVPPVPPAAPPPPQ